MHYWNYSIFIYPFCVISPSCRNNTTVSQSLFHLHRMIFHTSNCLSRSLSLAWSSPSPSMLHKGGRMYFSSSAYRTGQFLKTWGQLDATRVSLALVALKHQASFSWNKIVAHYSRNWRIKSKMRSWTQNILAVALFGCRDVTWFQAWYKHLLQTYNWSQLPFMLNKNNLTTISYWAQKVFTMLINCMNFMWNCCCHIRNVF